MYPIYYFLKTKDNQFKTAIEWKEKTNTVFPARLDYILYKNDQGYYVYDFKEVKKAIGKYLIDVPGFTIGTYYTIPKYVKKIAKIIAKAKFETIENAFSKVHLKHIID